MWLGKSSGAEAAPADAAPGGRLHCLQGYACKYGRISSSHKQLVQGKLKLWYRLIALGKLERKTQATWRQLYPIVATCYLIHVATMIQFCPEMKRWLRNEGLVGVSWFLNGYVLAFFSCCDWSHHGDSAVLKLQEIFWQIWSWTKPLPQMKHHQRYQSSPVEWQLMHSWNDLGAEAAVAYLQLFRAGQCLQCCSSGCWA